MLCLQSCREVRNGISYRTNSSQTMSGNGSYEDNRAGNPPQNTKEEVTENCILTQEEANV